MKMPGISVVVITFNEEKNIRRCLESVKDLADEMVVVDSFSTDGTEEICQELGARFIRNEWPGYTEQKNFANQQASNEWVLSLDADEALSEELRETISKIKDAPGLNGYLMNRMTNYCGSWIRHGSWYPDRQLRFFNRNKGKWEGEKIHERFVMNEGEKTGLLKGDLLHYSYYTVEEHVKQANHFTTLTAEVAFSRGKKAPLLKIFFSPIIKFLRDYLFKLGFLDGYAGFLVAQISANATFMKYVKLRELRQNSKTNDTISHSNA
jgi:glycosyltransferase involved in cell wall biosynthesis